MVISTIPSELDRKIISFLPKEDLLSLRRSGRGCEGAVNAFFKDQLMEMTSDFVNDGKNETPRRVLIEVIAAVLSSNQSKPPRQQEKYFCLLRKMIGAFRDVYPNIQKGLVLPLSSLYKIPGDRALMQAWPRIARQEAFPLFNTADEVRAWMGDPANAARLAKVQALNLNNPKLELELIPQELAQFPNVSFIVYQLYNRVIAMMDNPNREGLPYEQHSPLGNLVHAITFEPINVSQHVYSRLPVGEQRMLQDCFCADLRGMPIAWNLGKVLQVIDRLFDSLSAELRPSYPQDYSKERIGMIKADAVAVSIRSNR